MKSATTSHRRQSKARQTRRSSGRDDASEKPSTVSTLSLDKFETKVLPYHTANVINGFEVMWRQGVLCDVTIVVDHVRLRAHRALLATCSDYFHSAFTSSRGEHIYGEEFELYLENISVSTVESLLECVYTGHVSINEANVRDLLVAASSLQFYAIEDACGEFLLSKLNNSNCLRMLNLACTYNLQQLKENALKTAAAHFLDLTKGFDFQQLSIEQLLLLLSRDDIQVTDEAVVFRRALSWIEYEKESRIKHAGEVLSNVRLELMSASALVDQVEVVEELMAIPECQQLVKQALHYHCLPARQSILQSSRNKSSAMTFRMMQLVLATNRTVPRTAFKRECIIATGGAPRLKNDPVSCDVMCLDPKEGKWERLTRMEGARHHHAVATLGGFLYVAGGEETNDQRSPLNTAHRYDPRTDTWLQIASMNQRRESFQLSVLNNMLYAVGGRVDRDVSLADVERYNPAVDRWEKVAPLSVARRSIAVAAHAGRLYAMGGSGHRRISSKVERYNPLTNQWETRRALSTPRFFALLVPHSSQIFLLGGATVDNTGNVVCVHKVECYTPLTDVWSSVTPMVQPRAEAGCCILGTKIYVVGGYSWDDEKRLDSTEYYDIDRDCWTQGPPINGAYTGIGCTSLTVYHQPSPPDVSTLEPVTEAPSPAESNAGSEDVEERVMSVQNELGVCATQSCVESRAPIRLGSSSLKAPST